MTSPDPNTLPSPERMKLSADRNPNTACNATMAARTITSETTTRTAVGFAHRSACCKRPARKSMARGITTQAICRTSIIRLAMALDSNIPRNEKSIVEDAIP